MFPSLSTDNIRSLFDSAEWPRIESITPLESGYCLDLLIDQNIHWLQGHFPEQPLVAGVVQTHWAVKFSQTFFAIHNDVQQIDNLKFQNVLLPEQTIQLILEFVRDKNNVKFSYRKNTGQQEITFSEGKITFISNENNKEQTS